MLEVERRYRSQAKRHGLFEALERQIEQCFFDDEADARDFASRRAEAAAAGASGW
jgi:DNA sulfur modification protein DndC